jgi:GrpB-like predicted nucleotidyltransferase (UPF0157 family)
MPIALADPDPTWPRAYCCARDELLDGLGQDAFIGFEHIGSTSIPGLAAKPLVDMMASVRSLDEVAPMIERIEALGYDYLEELAALIPGRHLFERRSAGKPTEHLHIVEHEGENWLRHLGFRDWLRTHPEDRDAYETLKRELAAKHDDTKVYSEAKTPFVRRIEALAADAREAQRKARRAQR